MPNLFVAKANFRLETSNLKGSVFRKLFSIFGQSASSAQEEEKKRDYITLRVDSKLHVEYQNIRQLKLDDTGTLAMISVYTAIHDFYRKKRDVSCWLIWNI